jgi:hypothetical protein
MKNENGKPSYEKPVVMNLDEENISIGACGPGSGNEEACNGNGSSAPGCTFSGSSADSCNDPGNSPGFSVCLESGSGPE